jgi:long-chain acyl-CoA synthetase
MAHPRDHARLTPDKPAALDARTGAMRSYADLEARANGIAHLLRGQGLKPGDCIAILMEDRLDYFDIAWAAQRTGLYFLPVYASLSLDDTAAMVAHADSQLLFTSPAFLAKALAVAKRCVQIKQTICVGQGSANGLEALLKGVPSTPVADEAGGQPMQYSGGTTGVPKGIRRPAITGGIDTPDGLLSLAIERFGFGSDMRLSTTAPLHHVAPMRFSMMAHRLGGTTILLGEFDARSALANLERFAITHSHWVPDMLVRLVKLPVAERWRVNLATHRCAIHAAAPCPPAIKAQLLDWWGPIVHEVYAGTETPGFCMIGPEEWLRKPGSVGQSVVGDVRIVGPDGKEVTNGVIGQIYFADPLPFSYYKDPQRTKAAFNDQGWATIDDLGYKDDEGYVFLVERKGFAYTVGSRQVYPRRAEDAMIGHPAVADAGLAALPAPSNVNELVAVVLLLETETPDAQLAQAIISAASHLDAHERPTRLVFCSKFPRDDDGKIDRAALALLAQRSA